MYNAQYNDAIIDTIEEVLREEYNVCHNYAEVPNSTTQEFKDKIIEKTMQKINGTLESKFPEISVNMCAVNVDNTIYLLPSTRNNSIVFRISR